MNAVWMRARAELRARWRASVGLGVVIALAGGLVMAAAAGARRTESAYPRFVRAQNGDQGGLTSDPGHFFGFAAIDFDRVEKMPEVVDSARFALFIAFMKTAAGKELTPINDRNPVVSFAGPDDHYDRVLNAMRIRQGRLPDPANANEVVVSQDAADAYAMHVGQHLFMRLPSFADLSADPSQVDIDSLTGAKIDLLITGIEVSPGELQGGVGFPPIHMTPAFYARYSRTSPAFPAFTFKLHSDDEIPGFIERVQKQATIGGPRAPTRVEFLSFVNNGKQIQRTTHVQAIALWLLALLAGFAALLILAQTLSRQVALEADDYRVLSALGLTRTQLFLVSMSRVITTALGGAVLAVGLGFALSTLSPIGIARVAEPSPGFNFDAVVLGLGGIAFFIVLIALGALPALRVSRASVLERKQNAPQRPSRVADALARGALPPTSVTGVRMALQTGRGSSAVPLRSTLIGAVIGIAAVTTGLTFSASLVHVRHSPRAQGWNWSGIIGDDFDPDTSKLVEPVLSSDPRIQDAAAGGAANVSIRGSTVGVIGMEDLVGRIRPLMLDGVPPDRTDEIALGAATMRTGHINVGDTITVSSGQWSIAMKVTGRAIAPTGGRATISADGGWMTFAGLRALVPQNSEDIYIYRVRPGADARALDSDLRRKIGSLSVVTAPPQSDVDVLGRISNLPLVLAGLLALLAAATLTHLIVTGIRRRRIELAILKTLGFVRRQVRASVAWQASTVGVVALVLGIPLGVIAGRFAWSILANQMGFLSEPVVDLLALFIVIPATIIAVNLVAALPARAAARLRPALAFRTE
ncbi:MAG: FtsX-like permease family protein [Actinomycetota bacterium]